MRLVATDSGVALNWDVKMIAVAGGNIFELQSRTTGKNLAVGPEGRLHANGQHGKWACWEKFSDPSASAQGGDCDHFALRNAAHQFFLNVSSEQRSRPLSDDPVWLRAEVVSEPGSREHIQMPSVDTTVLSAEDIQFFKEQGYVIVRNAVPFSLGTNFIRHYSVRRNCRSANFE